MKDYDPTAAIERWYGQKKRRIGFGGHAYPEKRKKKVETLDASRRHAYFLDQESSESDYLMEFNILTCFICILNARIRNIRLLHHNSWLNGVFD